MTVLVIDAGTSGVRAVAIHADGSVLAERHQEVLPSLPAPGLVELDPVATATAALAVAGAVIDAVGTVTAVGIANQRATTVVWDGTTGQPIGPGLGWQDVRTVGRCLELRADGMPVAPNHTATKAEWLVASTDIPADRLRIGTVDSWLAWTLTQGACHVTDASNASVTGMSDGSTWDAAVTGRLGLPGSALPDIVDSAEVLGEATALAGAPLLASLVGDQQASMVGQGCIEPGQAKITFGTGGMLDVCLGADPGPNPHHGTFTMVGWRIDGVPTYVREAVMLSAGTAVAWLRDGLGIIADPADTAALAASVTDSEGVVFVPALHGIGTPLWDHGARGGLFGLTRGTSRAHVARAVLEGIAHRGADLVEATEADTGQRISTLGIDGGMTANAVFVAAVADATGHTVEVSAVREATALGAGYLAGAATGVWASLADAAATRPAPTTVTPGPADPAARTRFLEARRRCQRWIPELSALDL